MVLDIIKKYLTNSKSKYPNGFERILESFPSDYNLNQENIEFIWKAYQFGDDAHKDQKENQENHILIIALKLEYSLLNGIWI